MRNGKASAILDTMVLNALVGSTGMLVSSGIVVLLETATRMLVGSWDKGSEAVDLTYKSGNNLVVDASPMVGVGTRLASDIYMIFFLGVMAS